jgi:integrase
LIAEGFVAYAQTISVGAPVFPDKRLDKFEKRGGRAWNAVGRWVRTTVGITDPDLAPDHSWRHRVTDELRAQGVTKDARDAITGHAGSTMDSHYGVRGESLKRLHAELSKVPVPPGVVVAGMEPVPQERRG